MNNSPRKSSKKTGSGPSKGPSRSHKKASRPGAQKQSATPEQTAELQQVHMAPPEKRREVASKNPESKFSDGPQDLGKKPTDRKSSSQKKEPRTLRGSVGSFWHQWGAAIKRFAPLITLTIGAFVLIVLILSVILILAFGARFSALPATIGSLWLSFHLNSVTIAGENLGFSPLLPLGILAWGLAKRIRVECDKHITVRELRVLATMVIGIPTVLSLIAWFMVWDASRVFSVQAPLILLPLLITPVIYGCIFLWGIGPLFVEILLVRRDLPVWPADAFAIVQKFTKTIFIAGLGLIVLSMFTNFEGIKAGYTLADGWVSYLALTLISLLYIPNMALGAAGVTLLSDYSAGYYNFSIFGLDLGQLPPVPIMAALPTHYSEWMVGLPVVALACAIIGFILFVRQSEYIESPLYVALGAGVLGGLIMALLGFLATGNLGEFHKVGLSPWIMGMVTAGIVLLVSAVGLFILSRRSASGPQDIVDETDPESVIE